MKQLAQVGRGVSEPWGNGTESKEFLKIRTLHWVVISGVFIWFPKLHHFLINPWVSMSCGPAMALRITSNSCLPVTQFWHRKGRSSWAQTLLEPNGPWEDTWNAPGTEAHGFGTLSWNSAAWGPRDASAWDKAALLYTFPPVQWMLKDNNEPLKPVRPLSRAGHALSSSAQIAQPLQPQSSQFCFCFSEHFYISCIAAVFREESMLWCFCESRLQV